MRLPWTYASSRLDVRVQWLDVRVQWLDVRAPWLEESVSRGRLPLEGEVAWRRCRGSSGSRCSAAIETLLTVRESGDGSQQDDAGRAPPPPPRVTDAVAHERSNLHASVHLDAHDDLGRERLCRYLCRPAFSLARLRMRRDGNVSYRVKKASRGRVLARSA